MKDDVYFPLEVVVRDIPRTNGLEARIREKVVKLAGFYDKISRCRVVVESPHHHHQKGATYHVTIELGVPGPDIVVNRESERSQDHEQVGVALRDAFDAARRQLQDRLGRLRKHPQSEPGVEPEAEPTAEHELDGA